METEAFNEQAGRAKAHKYLATLSMHSSLTSLFQALKKEHLSDVFFPTWLTWKVSWSVLWSSILVPLIFFSDQKGKE